MTRWMVLVLVAVAAAACGEGGGSSTPPANCSSGDAWSGGNEESPEMNPGQACIACHESGEGPKFTIAGTVMGATNDDDNCNGPSGYTVEITGSDGKKITLTTNAAGNFSSKDAVATPYTATVTSPSGKTASMGSPQTSGDCNSCHTAKGANGAPGRISAPN